MENFISKVKTAIRVDMEDLEIKLSEDDIFVVWSCKTLQNKKAILGDTKSNYLYEATLNGDKGEVYLDIYKKKLNTSFIVLN